MLTSKSKTKKYNKIEDLSPGRPDKKTRSLLVLLRVVCILLASSSMIVLCIMRARNNNITKYAYIMCTLSV